MRPSLLKLLPITYVSFIVFLLACGGGGGGSNNDDSPPVSDIGKVATLSDLSISVGILQQEFDSNNFEYTATLAHSTDQISIMATHSNAGVITLNGTAVESGTPSFDIDLLEGDNSIELDVASQDGSTHNIYTLNLNRQSMQTHTQTAFIKASSVTENDRFGVVSIDGNTLAVGARYEDSSSTGINGDENNNASGGNSGAVYVFVLENGEWRQQAFIKPSNTGVDDLFGASIDLSGDTLVVGAALEDGESDALTDSGAVYVFQRTGNTWSQQAYIKAPQPIATGRLGEAVAVSGDILVTSARGHTSSGTEAGPVYVYQRENGEWTHDGTLLGSNSELGDLFGVDLDISGTTIAVGANGESSSSRGINQDQTNNDSSRSGAAYIFERNNETWNQTAYIKSENSDEFDNFGIQLALSNQMLAVSALESSNATGINGDQSDNSANQAGAVYVFAREAEGWVYQSYIKASNTSEGDWFGTAVDISDDQLVVGAWKETTRVAGVNASQDRETSATEVGAAYLFDFSNNQWQQTAYLKASNAKRLASFAEKIALSDDMIAVGAMWDSNPNSGVSADQNTFDTERYSGAVYVFPSK